MLNKNNKEIIENFKRTIKCCPKCKGIMIHYPIDLVCLNCKYTVGISINRKKRDLLK